jgi:hypothetical protein
MHIKQGVWGNKSFGSLIQKVVKFGKTSGSLANELLDKTLILAVFSGLFWGVGGNP